MQSMSQPAVRLPDVTRSAGALTRNEPVVLALAPRVLVDCARLPSTPPAASPWVRPFPDGDSAQLSITAPVPADAIHTLGAIRTGEPVDRRGALTTSWSEFGYRPASVDGLDVRASAQNEYAWAPRKGPRSQPQLCTMVVTVVDVFDALRGTRVEQMAAAYLNDGSERPC